MIEILIPFRTPSINKLYWHRGNMKILTKEARELREKIQKIVLDSIEGIIFDDTKEYEIVVEIHENWYTKDGRIKKVDISNREKFLVDSIFKSLEIDDKQIFKHTMIKKQSDKEFAIVTIK